MKKLLFLSLITGFAMSVRAQSNYCGTHQTEEDLAWLRSWQQTYVPEDGSRGGTTYYIPMKVHIVGTDDGTGYYNLTYLYTTICELNEHYAATGFVFYIYGDIQYIDNSDYYEHDYYSGGDMMNEYNVNNLLNVYFVADPAGNCGYFSPMDDGVAVAKSCAMPGGTTVAHEFGHFFSLPHTFYGWEYGTPDDIDQEWVNGANCETAADGFCDTPPDYLAYRWNCPGPEQTDPHGDTFFSDGTFYMSYSNDACTDKFSVEQQAAMHANLLGPRNNMLDFPEPVYVDLTETPALITPEDAAINQYPNYVYLEWTPVTGATQYHLQISFSPSFSAIAHDVVTTNTYYEETNLDPDKKYYWRVKPIAPLNYCESPSLAWSFTTWSEISSVQQSYIFGYFGTFPNPAVSGNAINIQYRSEKSFTGDLSLLDITGKVIAVKTIDFNSGSGTVNFELPEVGSGMYFLQISNGEATEVEKILVN